LLLFEGGVKNSFEQEKGDIGLVRFLKKSDGRKQAGMPMKYVT
jgi:hypothetical protein